MAASTTTLTKIMSDSLRGPMQLVIVLSHLSFAYAEPHSLFALANRFGTSVIALFFFIRNSYLYSLAVIVSSIILAFVAHRLLALINKK